MSSRITATTSLWLILFTACYTNLCTGLLMSSAYTHGTRTRVRPTSSAITTTHASIDEIRDRLKSDFLRKFDGPLLEDNIYACPESLKPLKAVTRIYGAYTERYFIEPEHGTVYPQLQGKYADLVLGAGSSSSKNIFDAMGVKRPGEVFFQNPIISGVYERGYRQNFENFGFPGIEKEFAEASAFFQSAGATKVVMDLSCGSGFMTRKFVGSSSFQRVIGADLSPNMLAESRRRFQRAQLPLPELIRCDSAKLPLQSNSLDAVHAGAAMHCWPNLQQSLAEVYRVLKPGGVFYASTFYTRSLGDRDVLKRSANFQGFYFFSSDEEIRSLVEDAGFSAADGGGSCVVRREGARCAIVKAQKAPVTVLKAADTAATTTSSTASDVFVDRKSPPQLPLQ